MDKVFILYWSGTGNTKAMAEKIGEGVVLAGKEAKVAEVTEINAEELRDLPAFALGCPAMGDEVLEEEYMEPFVAEIEKFAAGKKIGLFGSYGWGNCEWMRDWENRLINAGAEIINGEGITALNEPDDEALVKCLKLGKSLAVL